VIRRRRRADSRHESRDLSTYSRCCFTPPKRGREAEQRKRGRRAVRAAERARDRVDARVSRWTGNDVAEYAYAHVKDMRMFRVCKTAWKGSRGTKWVRKLGGGEEDKGGDLLPKLLLTPLLPALCLSAPNLLWALLTNHPQVVKARPGVDELKSDHGQTRSHAVSNKSEHERWAGIMGEGDVTYKPSGLNVSGSRR